MALGISTWAVETRQADNWQGPVKTRRAIYSLILSCAHDYKEIMIMIMKSFRHN